MVAAVVATTPLPPLFDPALITGYPPETAVAAAAAASATVRTYCGWHVAPSIQDTLVLDGNGGTVLPLPTLYVTDVSRVAVAGVLATDYEWSARGLLRSARWEPCWRSVEVDLTHGYDPVPEDVAAVALSVARQRLANPDGVRQETIRSYSVTFGGVDSANSTSSALGSAASQMILDRYRVFNAP